MSDISSRPEQSVITSLVTINPILMQIIPNLTQQRLDGEDNEKCKQLQLYNHLFVTSY